MRHTTPRGTSSLDSDVASTSQFSSSNSSVDTAPPSNQPSRNPSAESIVNRRQANRSSLKSNLKASKSAPTLAVRFSLPDVSPEMPGLPNDAFAPKRKPVPFPKDDTGDSSTVSLNPAANPALRKKLSKRFSAPSPISLKESPAASIPPNLSNPRLSYAPKDSPGSRVTSFQSTASAPAVLITPSPAPQPPLSPSQPPSQYNPLQHHVPCLVPGCSTHYTSYLLGPTFYSPQKPYQFVRKKGLCPVHAHRDLRTGNEKAKRVWEGMRQGAGRKTLGLIATEFELWCQSEREEREAESEELEAKLRRIVLGTGLKEKLKKKPRDTDSEKADDGWDWRYAPRPCTKKGCTSASYSVFDNRLYLFYHTSRPSGLVPLSTFCPSCARKDVEDAEERINGTSGGMDPQAWQQWKEQVMRDRAMEREYWEKAQERVVREKGVCWAGVEGGRVNSKAKKGGLKGICVVM